MGTLYKQYCYPTVEDAANAVWADSPDVAFLILGAWNEGGYQPSPTTPFAVVGLDAFGQVPSDPDNALEEGYFTITKPLPFCSTVGPMIDSFPISVELISVGFMGILSLWVAGLAVGLVMSQVRKVRMRS